MINNLYINDNSTKLGFFNTIDKETKVSRVLFDHVKIINTLNIETVAYTGVISGTNKGLIEECAILGGEVIVRKNQKDNNIVGGITGYSNSGKIKKCYNLASINSIYNYQAYYAIAGGISGVAEESIIIDCYNAGKITGIREGSSNRVCVGGIIGFGRNTDIKNCYHKGDLNYQNASIEIQVAGIVGRNGDMYGTNNRIENCYYLSSKCSVLSYNHTGNENFIADSTNGKNENEMKTEAFITTLGTEFTQDIKNPNGTWKYNEGYPILKWQIKK